MFSKALFTVVAGATAVAAHGFVNEIVINGVEFPGFGVTTDSYSTNPPTVIGWKETATDLGFVGPESYASSDIICHKEAENAKGHAQVAAGDNVFIQWNTWPESHKGPVLNYLAACSDAGCESVDKTGLEFFKIGEKGLLTDATNAGTPGKFASDELITNGLGWMVNIPASIAPGFYVLRHEMIALHSTGSPQNYPQCINIEVTGSGTDVPSGVKGTELYKATDAGLAFNIYGTYSSYPIPGPALYSGATELATQSTSAVTSTGAATTGTALALATSAPATTSAAAATTTAAAATSPAAVTSQAAATTFSTAIKPASSAPATTAAPSASNGCNRPRVKVITVTV
ncbi:glycoside hydrolase family 61 protein [Ophiostoma piceae UAMH 11346]|uniref:lytic cellulose monooxygenase (C4-dehydrogenating) n=1 Tax=Ophiostoma piceae (strain UAMH 11346) TaxID=1262450 RepID=S3CT27_OPHP1|nr:glycoside hydrolase family 61 protein [Ophiostoma piceae UAMH 11346]